MGLTPSLWVGLAGLVASVAAFFWGMQVESDSRDADLLVQERLLHEAYTRGVNKYRGVAQDVSKELSDERSNREDHDVRFRAELQKVRSAATPLATCAQPTLTRSTSSLVAVAPAVSAPIVSSDRDPEPRFTAEFVRLFDLALGAPGVPTTGDPWRVDAAASSSGTVDAQTVLAVHGENASAWRECRAALGGWQSLARMNGWAK